MANHKSSMKRARQTPKRNVRNRAARSVVRSLTKSVETLVESGDVKAATGALRSAESSLARAASRGILHKKTAARKTSRLAKRVKAAALAKK